MLNTGRWTKPKRRDDSENNAGDFIWKMLCLNAGKYQPSTSG
jgi:hypothetical protein